ncbi:MAG: iron ABC transporter substrate-binding protein [Oscillospiraceae bacterium]|jgi:iron complex transport system substrate-binding protein
MKKNTLKLTALTLALSLLFCGCGAKDTDSSPSASPSASATRTVTDMAGRSVEIPQTVNTVATLGATARILTYAGCADKITGLTELEMKGDAGMPYAYVNAEHFIKQTAVASGGKSNVNYEEAIATLNPDVIFINFSDASEVNTLQEKTGIPVVALSFNGIFNDGVNSAITLVGEVMGTQERCKEVVDAMAEWQKDLNDRTKNLANADKPSVYAGAVSFAGGHGIEGTYAKYPPFVAINAKNVVDETGEDGSLLIEKEKLVAWDPDVIFLTPANMNLVNEDYKANPSFYDNLKAVKNGQLYSQINYNYYGCNIELAIANAYYAGSVLYPEQFKDINIEEKADEIFKVMLGQPYVSVLKDNNNYFGKMTIGA